MPENHQESLLIINRHSPYGSKLARESLNIALSSSVFSLPTSLIFCDDGIFQLLDHQDTENIDQANLAASLQALEMYDIKHCYVLDESLQTRHIEIDMLKLSCECIDKKRMQQLIDQHTRVLVL